MKLIVLICCLLAFASTEEISSKSSFRRPSTWLQPPVAAAFDYPLYSLFLDDIVGENYNYGQKPSAESISFKKASDGGYYLSDPQVLLNPARP